MGWAGQKAHHGGLGDGVAEASRALSEAVVAVLSASRGIHKRVQALQIIMLSQFASAYNSC